MSRSDKVKSGSFLDKVLGSGTHRRKVVNRERTQLPRPNSEYDLNETEEDQYNLDNLTDEEVRVKFRQMMQDMNIDDSNIYETTPLDKMRLMLKSNIKIVSQNQTQNRRDTPQDFIEYLRRDDLSPKSLLKALVSLQVSLRSNKIQWLEEFSQHGLKILFSKLNECYRKTTTLPHRGQVKPAASYNTSEPDNGNNNRQWDTIQHEAIKCLKLICNHINGIKEFFKQSEAFTLLAQSLNPAKPSVMLEVVKMMTSFCLPLWLTNHGLDGHSKVLDAITIVGELNNMERFGPIIMGLGMHDNDPLRLNCLCLINSLINFVPDDNLDFRLHLRNEFMRNGLQDLLDILEMNDHIDIKKQLEVFNKYRLEDFEDWQDRFFNHVEEIEDINKCFDIVRNQVLDSECEPQLLSILQHLAFIRDDENVRVAYYKLIEECVSQIVLHRNGCDPDFRATKRFEIKVDQLLDQFKEETRSKNETVEREYQKQLQEALESKQKIEAELTQMQIKLTEAIKHGGLDPNKKGGLPNVPGLSAAIAGGGPPPPPPPPGMGGPPPPPPPPGMGGPPPPPPMPGMGGAPPPPPLPGMGGGPPPPPLPGMGGGPPPPPPPFGGPRPPMGGPPLPPGMGGLKMPSANVLPHGMTLKKFKKPDVQTKRLQWNKVIPAKMSEKSLWVRLNKKEVRIKSEVLKNLEEHFAIKQIKAKAVESVEKSSKKEKELKVLDQKTNQNLSIALRGQFKHMSHDEIRLAILECDEEVLCTDSAGQPDSSNLQSLITALPDHDVIHKLMNLSDPEEDFAEGELFLHRIGRIKKFVPLLKNIAFKTEYPSLIEETRKDIVCTRAAFDELINSKKFEKVLSYILEFGNVLNCGSRNADTIGFDISFLPKLANTKDGYGNTLLHYLAEVMLLEETDIADFEDGLIHFTEAERVSTDSIKANINKMKKEIKNIGNDLQRHIKQDSQDRFIEKFTDFHKAAENEISLVETSLGIMLDKYKLVSEMFTFELEKYTQEDFFRDFNEFIVLYKKAKTDVLKDKEKKRKEVEARERAELDKVERAERDTRQRALHDVTNDQTNTEVMDQLEQLITTGQVFDVMGAGRRRRQQKTAAERRAQQLNRSRSRSGITAQSPTSGKEMKLLSDCLNIDDLDENLQPPRPSRARSRRPGLPTGLESRERDFDNQNKQNNNVNSLNNNSEETGAADSREALLRRLKHL